MKKKILIPIGVVLVIIAAILFIIELSAPLEKSNHNDGFTSTVGHRFESEAKEIKIDKKDMDIKFTAYNDTEEQVSLSLYFELEYKKDGEWYVIPANKLEVQDIGIIIGANKTHQFSVDFNKYGHDFKAGEYRLIQTNADVSYVAYFEMVK